MLVIGDIEYTKDETLEIMNTNLKVQAHKYVQPDGSSQVESDDS